MGNPVGSVDIKTVKPTYEELLAYKNQREAADKAAAEAARNAPPPLSTWGQIKRDVKDGVYSAPGDFKNFMLHHSYKAETYAPLVEVADDISSLDHDTPRIFEDTTNPENNWSNRLTMLGSIGLPILASVMLPALSLGGTLLVGAAIGGLFQLGKDVINGKASFGRTLKSALIGGATSFGIGAIGKGLSKLWGFRNLFGVRGFRQAKLANQASKAHLDKMARHAQKVADKAKVKLKNISTKNPTFWRMAPPGTQKVKFLARNGSSLAKWGLRHKLATLGLGTLGTAGYYGYPYLFGDKPQPQAQPPAQPPVVTPPNPAPVPESTGAPAQTTLNTPTPQPGPIGNPAGSNPQTSTVQPTGNNPAPVTQLLSLLSITTLQNLSKPPSEESYSGFLPGSAVDIGGSNKYGLVQ